VIRRASVADADAVVRVYVDSWNEGFGDLLPRRSVTKQMKVRWRDDLAAGPPHHWWVADQDGSVIGVAGVGPSRDPIDPALGELDTIAVAPSHWRAGVGRSLMDVAVRQLVDDGYREAVLWTPAGYERGAAFYSATGWTLDGATRDQGRQVSYRRVLHEPALQ
jgi:GNAT superfamily N-acetyltransferase